MKTHLLTLLATAGLALAAHAAEPPKHAHARIQAGPNNGRLLTGVAPHVEFLVTPAKTVELRFVGVANQVVPPGEQEVTVTLGERAKPTRLTFTREGDKLVSSGPVPEGNDYPTVVQIRAKAGAKPVNEKFNLNLTKCPTCKNGEYACKCDHAH